MLESTKARDDNQVALRWAEKHTKVSGKDHPLLMVDQLWIWVLQDGCYSLSSCHSLGKGLLVEYANSGAGTVISSFSDPWDPSKPAPIGDTPKNSYTLKDIVSNTLNSKEQPYFVDSPERLLHLILRAGLDFFERQGPLGIKFQDCFQASMNDVVRKCSLHKCENGT